MSIPTPAELRNVWNQAFTSSPFRVEMLDEDYQGEFPGDRAAIAVRDAVLEGAARKAEHPMIGYGASDDEGGAVADWLRSLKVDQP